LITSKQIVKLLDVYYKGLKVRSTFVSIYENPDRGEIQEIIGGVKKSQSGSFQEVRFIADGRSQKIYVWDAYYAEHTKVLSLAGLPSSRIPYVLTGGCNISGSELKIVWDNRPEDTNSDYYKKNPIYDWGWLGKYMNINGYLPKLGK
jgi:hypothetical protein